MSKSSKYMRGSRRFRRGVGGGGGKGAEGSSPGPTKGNKF